LSRRDAEVSSPFHVRPGEDETGVVVFIRYAASEFSPKIIFI
jgi:hypothetical protein